MAVYGPVEPLVIVIEGLVNQLVAGEHLVGVSPKSRQQCSPGLTQGHGHVIDSHAAGRLVQDDVALGQDLLEFAHDPAEHREGVGEDFLRVEGFNDAVFGSAVL